MKTEMNVTYTMEEAINILTEHTKQELETDQVNVSIEEINDDARDDRDDRYDIITKLNAIYNENGKIPAIYWFRVVTGESLKFAKELCESPVKQEAYIQTGKVELT